MQDITNRFKNFSGKVSFFYKDLTTSQTQSFNKDLPLVAASVIKIPIMIEAFRQFENGLADKNEKIGIKKYDKMPSCGALTYMHDGLEVTLLDLVTLMIILSDNTATNLVIKRLGMENINNNLKNIGIVNTKLNRLLFDSEKASLGVENYITVQDIATILEKLYRKELVSKEADSEMIEILSNQRLNSKIPFYIGSEYKIAHKTGEDSGITHDCGIVFSEKPFILCCASNEVNKPEFEVLIQNVAKEIATN